MARPLALALALAGLLLAACGTAAEPPEDAGDEDDAAPDATASTDTARAEEPVEPALHVVATVAPVADLVSMVGGDRVEVTSLVPPGADSHTYEPRPGDVAGLSDADAFLGVGLGLNDGAVQLARQHLDDESVILLGERHLDDGDLVHDHVHDHEHDDGDEHDHGHGGPNPHVWTGLSLAADLVDGIAAELAALDAAGAEAYERAAVVGRERIEALDERIAEAVDTIPPEDRVLVVYHDAWSYLAHDHGLEMVVAVQPSDFAEPSASDVAAIIDLLEERDAPALFGSEVFPSDVLDTIAAETGATYVGDLADDVLPGEPGDPEHDYLGLMRRNAALIVEGLGGDAAALTD